MRDRFPIRYRPEADMFRWEVRNPEGRIVGIGWDGTKRDARVSASRARMIARESWKRTKEAA